MDKEKRAFKGVFVPANIWLNEEIKPSEKMLLTEIDSLDTQNECFANNDHFTSFLNVSKGRVSQMISHLKRLGFINVKLVYKKNSKQIEKRIITINKQRFYGDTHLENDDTPLENYSTPLENAQDNISSNKSINKKTPRPKHKKRVYDKDSDYYKLSEFFISQIKQNNPNFKDPNIQKWSDDFRKIVEIDDRDKHEVAMLIKWVQKDSFWMANVLSPAKLKKQYDSLIMRMNNSSEPHVLKQEKPLKPKNKIDSKKKDELLKEARERDKELLGEK